MKEKALKFHYITLLIFCQALAFSTLSNPTIAASNEVSITCPTEAAANSNINCTISGKTASEINNITLTINSSNLQIKEFKPTSGWTNNSSSKNTLNLSSTASIANTFSLGTLTLTSASSSQSEAITLENIEFQKTDNYRFNATGAETSVKITEAPVTPTCAADEELINGTCVKKQKICAEDEELIDGECVKKPQTCADDEELVDGQCVKKPQTCADDEELVDGECVKKPQTCADDEELVDGQCVKKEKTCQKDEELIDGECVKKEKTCQKDEELINGKCVKKIITPVCKDDEELIDNTCQKKKPDWTLIAIIAGGSLLIIGIIIAIILVIKKGKKGTGAKGYTAFSSSPNLSTGFRSTSAQSSVGNYSSGARTQTNLTQSSTVNTSTSVNSSNGTFLARSGEIMEAQTTPTINTDPRLQMQIQNPNQNTTPDSTSPNNPLTNKIEQGSAMASYDDPRLQYNFSENKQIMPTAQPQPTQIQTPVVSIYDVATQAASQPEQQTQQPIQVTPTTDSQPNRPIASQSYQQSPLIQNNQYRPTASVPLSTPNDPTVFES